MNLNINMNTMKNFALAGLSLLSAGTLGYALYVSKKTNDVVSKCEKTINKFDGKIDDATEKLSEEISGHIHDAMIEESVNKAVKQKAETTVNRYAEMACNSCAKEWRTTINKTVLSAWENKKEDLTKDLMDRVGEIDPSEVKKEAVAVATQKMLEGVNEAAVDAINRISRTYMDRVNPAVGSSSSIFFNASNTTDVAVKAILAVALKSSSDYHKDDYADKIVNLVKENGEGYLYAVKALQEISDSMTSSYYRGQIAEKIIELSKEA